MLLDRLVIGSSIESLLYAFLNDCYYLQTNELPPLFYKKINPKLLLSSQEDYSWSRLTICLSLTGKLLNYENFSSAKIVDNTIKIYSSEGMHAYDFSLCEVFDTSMISLENDVTETNPETYLVLDDLELSNLGGKHPYLESKFSTDPFATEIHYYNSDRVDGANYVTDCVVLSTLNSHQISDVDYSDSIIKFAVERHLESININGSFMNWYKSGKPKFRKPKVEHKKRIIRKIDNNKYKNTKSIKFLKHKIQEIIDEHIP
tara:strand:+ start:790 stop:1569 length:780 start_codon:yes stop_codon:yes gene_type:complete